MGFQERFDLLLQENEKIFFREIIKSKNRMLKAAIVAITKMGHINPYDLKIVLIADLQSVFLKRFDLIIQRSVSWHLKEILQSNKKAVTIEDVTVADSLFSLWAQEYYRSVGLPSITKISDTTVKDLTLFLETATRDGLQINEIVKGIRNLAKVNNARARTIARTETHGAAIYGSIKTADHVEQELGIKYYKRWIPVQDARTRDHHIAMLGSKPILKDEYFIVNGERMYAPNDRRSSASNYINCRCALTWLSEDAIEALELQDSNFL